MGLRPLTCWDYGSESRKGHGYLSYVVVVCFVTFSVLFVCICVLNYCQRGGYPIAVKYIISLRNEFGPFTKVVLSTYFRGYNDRTVGPSGRAV